MQPHHGTRDWCGAQVGHQPFCHIYPHCPSQTWGIPWRHGTWGYIRKKKECEGQGESEVRRVKEKTKIGFWTHCHLVLHWLRETHTRNAMGIFLFWLFFWLRLVGDGNFEFWNCCFPCFPCFSPWKQMAAGPGMRRMVATSLSPCGWQPPLHDPVERRDRSITPGKLLYTTPRRNHWQHSLPHHPLRKHKPIPQYWIFDSTFLLSHKFLFTNKLINKW